MSAVIAVAKTLVLLIVGAGLAVPVFAAIFSNVSSREDYILALAFIAAAYVVAAGIAGLLARSWMLPLWLIVPATALLIWYSTKATQQVAYHGAVFATLALATIAGALGGMALRGVEKRHVSSDT